MAMARKHRQWMPIVSGDGLKQFLSAAMHTTGWCHPSNARAIHCDSIAMGNGLQTTLMQTRTTLRLQHRRAADSVRCILCPGSEDVSDNVRSLPQRRSGPGSCDNAGVNYVKVQRTRRFPRGIYERSRKQQLTISGIPALGYSAT